MLRWYSAMLLLVDFNLIFSALAVNPPKKSNIYCISHDTNITMVEQRNSMELNGIVVGWCFVYFVDILCIQCIVQGMERLKAAKRLLITNWIVEEIECDVWGAFSDFGILDFFFVVFWGTVVSLRNILGSWEKGNADTISIFRGSFSSKDYKGV